MVLFQLLHKNVDSLEKRLEGAQGTLTLMCKDFEILSLECPRAEDCLNLAASVEALSNLGKQYSVELLCFQQFLTLLYKLIFT